jgi:S1-C subfamily serine protease
MSSVTTPKRRPAVASLLSGVLGGLVVLVVGAILIATDVIDTGDDETRVVRESTISRPTDDGDGAGRSVQDVYGDVGPGVVFITARGVTDESPFGFPQEGTATGSGFVLDREGYILTNDHVVEGSDDVSVGFSEDGDPVDATVEGRDPSSDLALLKVDPDDAKLDPVSLGDSSKVRVGDPVAAIGNPFGVGRTITTGIVSAVQRRISAPNGFTITGAIQTDASINPGNSGGPLLDAEGRVIGVNSQIATGGGRGSVGIGFAVPVNTVKRILPQLKRGEQVKRPFIGITSRPLTDELARQLDVPVDDGALIERVTDGTPADRAGLRSPRVDAGTGEPVEADVLVRVAGRAIRKPEDIAVALEGKKPGDVVALEYYRGDERKRVRLKLAEFPEEELRPADEGPGPLIP